MVVLIKILAILDFIHIFFINSVNYLRFKTAHITLVLIK